jgi:CheY-like chemotaxis protein
MSQSVLIIENDESYLKELTQLLEGEGLEVRSAGEGNRGLEMVQDDRPDLIVLAIELPTVSGFSVCKKLKRNPALSGIPLFLTSSTASEDTFAQHKKLKTRAEEYFIKPFSASELWERAVPHLGIGAEPEPEPEPEPEAEPEAPAEDLVSSSYALAEPVTAAVTPEQAAGALLADADEPVALEAPAVQASSVSSQSLAAVRDSELVDSLRAEIAEREEAYRQINNQHQETLTQLLDAQDATSRVQRQSLEHQQAVTRQNLEMERIRSQFKRLENDARTAAVQAEDFRTRLADTESARDEMSAELLGVTAERDELRTELIALKAGHEEVTNDYDLLEDRFNDQLADMSRFKQQVTAQADKLAEQRVELETASAGLAKSQEENGSMAEEQRRLSSLVGELEEKVAELDKRAGQAETSLEAAGSERDQLRGALETAAAENADAKASIETLTGERDELKASLAAAEAERDSGADSAAAVSSERDALSVERDELQELLEAAEAEREEANSGLEEHKTALQTAVERAEALAGESDQHATRVDELTAELEEAHKEISAAKAQRSGLEENFRKSEAALAQAADTTTRLTAELATARELGDERESELKDALRELNEAQTATVANLNAAASYSEALENRLSHAAEAFQKLGELLSAGSETVRATRGITALPHAPEYVDIGSVDLPFGGDDDDPQSQAEMIAEELADSLSQSLHEPETKDADLEQIDALREEARTTTRPVGHFVSLGQAGEAISTASGIYADEGADEDSSPGSRVEFFDMESDIDDELDVEDLADLDVEVDDSMEVDIEDLDVEDVSIG